MIFLASLSSCQSRGLNALELVQESPTVCGSASAACEDTVVQRYSNVAFGKDGYSSQEEEEAKSNGEENIQEEVDKQLVLCEITAEMEEVILRAKHSAGEVFVDSHKIQIRRKDINTLHGNTWLNDEIINFYLQMIVK